MIRWDTFGGLAAMAISAALVLYFIATVVIPLAKWVFGASL